MIQRLKVVFSREANRDLASIANYVVADSGSAKVALGFRDRIRQRCERIGDAPNGGRSRNDLRPGLRTVPFEHSAVITYVVAGPKIRIVRIYYGGRDFETLVRNSAPASS